MPDSPAKHFTTEQLALFERGSVETSRDAPGECWLWEGGRDAQGYGRVSWQGSDTQAHRLSHLLATGETPEAILHSCDNPSCVRPSHLSSGTRRDNNLDKVRKGRHLRGMAKSQDKVKDLLNQVTLAKKPRGRPKKVKLTPDGVKALNLSLPEVKNPRINPKREAFIREYVKDHNGTQAAIRAGYAPKAACAQAADILSIPNIRAKVEELDNAALAKSEITAERIVQGLTDLAYPADPTEDTHFSKIVYPKDRLKALELLAKYRGLFTLKHEVSGPGGAPIQVQTMSWMDIIAKVELPE